MADGVFMADTMAGDFDFAQELLTWMLWSTLLGIIGVVLLATFLLKKYGGCWAESLSSVSGPRLGLLEAAPIDGSDLPQYVKSYFMNNHPLVQGLGFELVGNYRVVHGPVPIYARYYWRRVNGTFVEVAICRSRSGGLFKIDDVRSVTFISVFEDGTCIQTGNASGPSTAKTSLEQLRLHYRPFLPPSELMNEHRVTVDAYRREARTRILHYPPEQLASVSEYYAQMQRERWLETGRINPPDGYDTTALRHGFAEEAESH